MKTYNYTDDDDIPRRIYYIHLPANVLERDRHDKYKDKAVSLSVLCFFETV